MGLSHLFWQYSSYRPQAEALLLWRCGLLRRCGPHSLHALHGGWKGPDWPGLESIEEKKMQPLTFTFNDLAQQQRENPNNWLFWMIVLWIIIADDDRERALERKRRRQDRRESASAHSPAPKPPTP